MLRCCRPFFRRVALRVSLGMVVSWIGCSGLGAVTIHDTFGPGLSTDGNYSTGCNAAICIQATTFVPSVTAGLETVVVPLGVLSGYPLVFSIWTDANEKPDVMLESWTISPPTITPANLTLSSVVSPLLLSGTPYWALYTATSDSFSPPSIFWGEFSSAQPGGIWGGTSIDSMTHDYAGLPAPALHIDGAVPEPTTLTLMLAGLTVLSALVRRH